MKKLKSLAILFMTAVLTISLAGCSFGEEESESASKIRLGVYTGGADHIMAIVGQEKGFFENHGLQIDVTQFATGINTVDAIVTGQSDIGLITDYAGVNRIGSTKENCDIKIISRYTTSDSYWTFYVNPELIKEPADLGKYGIANIQGTILEYYNSAVLEHAGISESESKLLNVDSEQTALGILSGGEAAAGWLSAAAASKAEEIGLTAFYTMSDLGLTVDGYYVASDTLLKNNKSTAEEFLSAISDIQEWIGENPDETAALAESKDGVPAAQTSAVLKGNNLILDLGEDSQKHLNSIKAWAIQAGNFNEDFEITDFMDKTVLENVLSSKEK